MHLRSPARLRKFVSSIGGMRRLTLWAILGLSIYMDCILSNDISRLAASAGAGTSGTSLPGAARHPGPGPSRGSCADAFASAWQRTGAQACGSDSLPYDFGWATASLPGSDPSTRSHGTPRGVRSTDSSFIRDRGSRRRRQCGGHPPGTSARHLGGRSNRTSLPRGRCSSAYAVFPGAGQNTSAHHPG